MTGQLLRDIARQALWMLGFLTLLAGIAVGAEYWFAARDGGAPFEESKP